MKKVLITAIGSFSASCVIAACKSLGFSVVGCDIYPAKWVANSADTDVFYQAPRASEKEAYLAFIEDICQKEQVDFLLPLTDIEIDVLREARKKGRSLGAKVCMSSDETLDLCRHKWKMWEFLNPLGICRTIPTARLKKIRRGLQAGKPLPWEFPLVLKPTSGRSSEGLYVVKDMRKMRFVLSCIEETEEYLVQPKLTGNVITVDVVRNPHTGRCVCLPRRELLRTLNGAGTSVYVYREPELEKQCEKIAEALGVEGCVNMEFIEVSGEKASPWYFLECNPRFAGGVAFSVKAGYDMVKNHLRCFMGHDLEPMGQIEAQYIARRYEEYQM